MSKNVKTKQFRKFLKFNKWYTKLGGRGLTPEQIENTFPKFQTNE